MISVPNFSFENPGNGNFFVTGAAAGGATISTAIPGFVFANDEYSGLLTPNASGQLGSQVAFINVFGSDPASITSAAPVTTIQANTSYLLTVAVGNPNGSGNFNDPGNGGLNLLANTSAAPSVFSVVATNSNPITTATTTDGGFKDFIVLLTAPEATALAGNQLEIQLTAADPGSSAGYQIYFDNIRLDATVVPEPSAYALVFGALALLCFFIPRRLAA